MIAMKLAWLLLESIFIWFFLYFGSGAAAALALLLFLVPLCSLPVNLYIRKHLELSVEAPVSLRKGDRGSIVVKLRNPTWFPVLRLICKVCTENQLNRDKQILSITAWAFPKKNQKMPLRFDSDYCGRIRVSFEQAKLYDCFGLVGLRCDCAAVAHTAVQPDTFEINVNLIPNPNSTEESEEYSPDRPGFDMTETYQIREYAPGDSPRQIHWKLSSKFDRLIVRDPALPITRNVLVLWERTGESGDWDVIDAQAEVLISLCRSLLDAGIQFTVGWNDTDRNICILHEIRDMDELVGIVPRLLRASGAKDSVSGAALLMQTRMDALCGHMVYIAEEPQSELVEMQRFGHVTALLCGQTAADGSVMFDKKNYSVQLSEIAI